ETGSCVAVGDWNGDGHPDLFVGRRVVAGKYGLSPRSYLLENDGTGHFRDVSLEKAPALAQAGMVTAATWIDYDHDGRLDLIVTGEWIPVRVFHQENGRLGDRTALVGLIPQLRSRYPSYADFGASRIDDIFPAAELQRATLLEARVFASSVALNNGDGTFTLQPLPAEAQFAPVYAALAGDFDGDG